MTRADLVGRVVMALGVAASAITAWATGGARDAAPPLPHPATSGTAPASAAVPATGTPPSPVATKPPAGSDGLEIVARLVDQLGEATLTMPNRERGAGLLAAHWRKMTPPYARVTGDARKLATSIALRTSDAEVQWAVPTSSGGTWAPDARVWNMSEGSFDQRESIFAPTPATLTFRVAIPAGGQLTFAAGTANGDGDATTFRVVVRDAGVEKTVFEERLLPERTRGWTERAADLSAFAGRTVDLSLVTEASPRTATDPRPAARARAEKASAEAHAPTGGPTLALWGNPAVLGRGPTRVPYNVLFIVIDALRPDVLASFHDDAEDAAKLAAKVAPQDAWLPKIPGLTPNLDALAERGVRFRHAYSAGAWTRPGTLAMLSGARSSELGLDTLPWVLPDATTRRFYASEPPMLPLLLGRNGVATRAFVNNYFMVGYAPVGVDMGFERVDDHRFRTKDTALVTASALAWIEAHKDERFFAFCNYNSPHEPWEPPARFLERVPKPPAGPRDDVARRYMAEAAKDDEAIGLLLGKLDALGLRERTLIVVTADHGETLAFDHDGTGLDKMRVRYHHAVSNYEETTRVPILMSLPKVLPAGRAVEARVRNVDIAPTILELLGVERGRATSGRSLLPLVRGETEPDERVVLSEGRGTRGLIVGRHRLLAREGAAQVTVRGDRRVQATDELYDLDEDPGERRDLARQRPELVKELRARLAAATANVPAADAKDQRSEAAGPAPRIRLRFAGGGRVRRVSGKLVAGDAKLPATLTFEPIGIPRDAVRASGSELSLALSTDPEEEVGLDVVVEPAAATLRWELSLDDAPWPAGAVYAGAFGLFDASVAQGLTDERARAAAYATALPEIDAQKDLGLFVIRERKAEASAPERETNAEGSKEMDRLLEEWGYAHKKGKK